jgi:hypothetical protein
MTLANSPTEEVEAKRLVLDGKCIAFVGAGASIPPGENWNDTVRRIATHCGIPIEDNMSRPEIIDKCLDKDEATCNQACRDLFPRHIASSRPAMDYLLRLPFKALLTTNFDPWLRQHSRRDHYQRCHIYPDLPLHYGLKDGIYYLHGYFDSEDRNATVRALVFGERSFREAYEGSLLPGFLLNVFTYETVLFVGVDPTEQRLFTLLQQSISIRKQIASDSTAISVPPKRFILWPTPVGASPEQRAQEDATISAIRSLETTLVLYDRKKSDYRGLEELLFSWIEEGDLKNRPAPFKAGFDLGRHRQPEEGQS